MCQFMLYRNEDTSTNATYPYFIDVQNSLLDELNTRLVIPLSPHTSLQNAAAKKLCPIFHIDSEDHVLLTHQMTSVPKSILKTQVSPLKQFRHEIFDAIDMLISGI